MGSQRMDTGGTDRVSQEVALQIDHIHYELNVRVLGRRLPKEGKELGRRYECLSNIMLFQHTPIALKYIHTYMCKLLHIAFTFKFICENPSKVVRTNSKRKQKGFLHCIAFC